MRALCAILVLAAAGVAGCSSSKSPTAAPVTQSVTVTATATAFSTVTVTATPSPPPVTAPLAIGATYTGSDFTATVYAFNATSSPSAPAPQNTSEKYADADVKVCITSGAAGYINTIPWTLVDTNDGTYDAASIGYRQFPTPQYPSGDTPIVVGQCYRGFIVFDVAKTATIKSIRYSIGGVSRPISVITWAAS